MKHAKEMPLTSLPPLFIAVWVSRLGTISLGAVAASSELFTLTIAASLALREASSSTLARLYAQGQRAQARIFARQCVGLALVIGLVTINSIHI